MSRDDGPARPPEGAGAPPRGAANKVSVGAVISYRHEAMRLAGEKVGAGRSGERAIDVFNPFTRKRIGSVPKATVDEVRQAFRIARAYRATLSRYERARILDKAAALVRERTPEIAGLISAESGLCQKDTTYEAGRVADVLSFGAN